MRPFRSANGARCWRASVSDLDADSLFREAAQRVSAETGHSAALAALRLTQANALSMRWQKRAWESKVPNLAVEIFGRTIRNPVGLAAGFDKNAVAIRSLIAMGFGFVEAGTVTPKPQPGNPKKRVFRIADDQAIVNRLGFNSRGLKYIRRRLARLGERPDDFMLGINIGKNTSTSVENAVSDYEVALEGVYELADYVALNLSSPNSPGLRELQSEDYLDDLIGAVLEKREQLRSRAGGKQTPIAIKLSPDLTFRDIEHIADVARRRKIDAIIATNTTTSRPAQASSHANYRQQGGLSGKPLSGLSTQVIKTIAEATDSSIPIIGVGGISSAEDAWEKMLAGATLVQIYTALAYQGPDIVRQIVSGLADCAAPMQASSFADAQKIARRSRKGNGFAGARVRRGC